jgi:hypothetical protein
MHMRYRTIALLFLSVQFVMTLNVPAADIIWTKTTGQYPVECTPVLGTVSGQPALIAINRNGEVMAWGLDGSDMGGEPDGRVAQLPKGVWSSSPAVISEERGGDIIACNTKGLVVALDGVFQPKWEFQLPGETSFSCAAPAMLPLPGGQSHAFVIGDQSGTVTCLDTAGKPVWQTQLGTGECDALVAVFEDGGGLGLVASAGAQLHRLDIAGKILWSRDLKANVSSRAEVLDLGEKRMIFCGTVAGDLHALAMDGSPVWTGSIGDEVGNTITLMPRLNDGPLVLCTGLWGNLYAYDEKGRRVWTHVFRSKNRGRPAVFDANGDGKPEVLVTTYSEHACLFDQAGNLLDDLRLSGCINGSTVVLESAADTAPEVVTVDASLLAHRFSMGAPKSVYGPTSAPESVKVTWPSENAPGTEATVRLDNPNGGVLCVNVRCTAAGGDSKIQGCVTARSAFELPLPGGGLKEGESWQCSVRDADGKLVAESAWTVPAQTVDTDASAPMLRAWATPAYGLFDGNRLTPCSREGGPVRLASVCQDELEQGAFILASSSDAPCRAHVELSTLKTEEGKPFGGTVTLYELLQTGTVNGERVPDALMDLGDARVATVFPKSASKFWLQADARNAEPGKYAAKITFEPLYREVPAVEMAVEIEVLPLRLPSPPPISACTWDYVPNKWFPDRTTEVLDDMQRHGVNIFPRTGSIPKGKVDDDGLLSIDWTDLDTDLKRYEGRGTILFQLTEPPITFAAAPDAAKKRELQVQYLHEWRDYLKAHGRDYGSYAFYPVDEPGLGYGGNNVQLLIDSAKLFREADPRFRIYTDPVPGLSGTDYERLAPFIDVWCPNMRLMSGGLCNDPRVAGILASGKTVWSYECVSQVRSLSPLCYNRANPWRGDFFGLSGVGYWTHSTTQVNEWFPGKSINDEYALVYPGPLPVSSVRWEAVRDGLEDVAAARLLRDAANAPGTDAALREQAVRELRMAHTDAMEVSDEAFIESRDFLRAGDRRIWHTWTDAENYTRHRARMAELTLALTGKERATGR